MHLACYPTSGESEKCERHGKLFSKASSDRQIQQVASTPFMVLRIIDPHLLGFLSQARTDFLTEDRRVTYRGPLALS
jgi:hypothetical protein